MIYPIYTFILFIMSMWQPVDAHAMSKKAKPPFTNEVIGVQTFEYLDEGRNRPVIVELWYPTDENNPPKERFEEDVWVHPKEARNVSLSAKRAKYPLILMSHGHRGDRRERTWLADSLARHGYIVASVEHHGNVWHKYDPKMSFKFWERAKDISFSLTQILQESGIKNHIDSERIGFVGYSMGGMTGLALAGAQSKYAQKISKAIQEKTGEISLEEFNELDFTEAEKDFLEPRIHSILLICPATFAYLPEALKTVKTPIGLLASVDDELLPHSDHAAKIIEYAPPKKTKLLKNKVSHYAFLNRMTEKGAKLLNKGVEKPVDWSPIHKETADFTIEYFEETLPEKAK